MAVKLQIYIKRKRQTLEQWVVANGLTTMPAFLAHLATRSLSATEADVLQVKKLLSPRKATDVIAPLTVFKQKKKSKKVLDESPTLVSSTEDP